VSRKVATQVWVVILNEAKDLVHSEFKCTHRSFASLRMTVWIYVANLGGTTLERLSRTEALEAHAGGRGRPRHTGLICCGAFQAILDGFPLGRAGRDIYRNPVVISSVRLMENFVERGSVVGGGGRHLDRVDRLP